MIYITDHWFFKEIGCSLLVCKLKSPQPSGVSGNFFSHFQATKHFYWFALLLFGCRFPAETISSFLSYRAYPATHINRITHRPCLRRFLHADLRYLPVFDKWRARWGGCDSNLQEIEETPTACVGAVLYTHHSHTHLSKHNGTACCVLFSWEGVFLIEENDYSLLFFFLH